MLIASWLIVALAVGMIARTLVPLTTGPSTWVQLLLPGVAGCMPVWLYGWRSDTLRASRGRIFSLFYLPCLRQSRSLQFCEHFCDVVKTPRGDLRAGMNLARGEGDGGILFATDRKKRGVLCLPSSGC
jgi:hypothetical protein